ncbi:MAG: rod shape-determining protein MreC [Gemmatimonadaceae bacterium]|nr:rod shape-determining protein MreC [Gemmatimonadaceae bacterium]
MARTSRTGTRTDLALLGAAVACALAALVLPTAARDRVQGALRSSVVAPLVSAQAWAERGRSAISDHGRLITRVDSLALASQAVEPLRSENDRLRALLGLGQRLGWGFVATELLHPPRGGDEHVVLLAAGSAAGVRAFSPLVVPEGLIGMVTSAAANSATAILWTHPDFRVSATTTDGAAFGIVAAHLGSGADRFLLEMRGVPFRSELKPGTLIVSSGLGNVFPRGIPIGVVLRETKTIEGWARTYLIRPIVSPDDASAAVVLLPPRAAAGVAGAWSSVSQTDATQRAIVAAGDSLIADSVRVVQERLAKLALLDSLRRAAIYRGDSGVRVEGDSAPPAPVPPGPATAAPASGAGVPAAVTPAATTPTIAPPAARPPATARPRPRTDSAAARRRSAPKPPENPFRLPPGRGTR